MQENLIDSKPNFILAEGKLNEVDRFTYRGSYASPGGHISKGASSRIR